MTFLQCCKSYRISKMTGLLFHLIQTLATCSQLVRAQAKGPSIKDLFSKWTTLSKHVIRSIVQVFDCGSVCMCQSRGILLTEFVLIWGASWTKTHNTYRHNVETGLIWLPNLVDWSLIISVCLSICVCVLCVLCVSSTDSAWLDGFGHERVSACEGEWWDPTARSDSDPFQSGLIHSQGRPADMLSVAQNRWMRSCVCVSGLTVADWLWMQDLWV